MINRKFIFIAASIILVLFFIKIISRNPSRLPKSFTPVPSEDSVQGTQIPSNSSNPAENRLDTGSFIVYQLWLNYFAKNPDADQTSDSVFQNASQKLKDIASLGVTTIQLSPIHPFSGKGTIGSPYGSRDYYDIHPGYSPQSRTKEERIIDFKNFVDNAHQNGLKVIMDCVYHSTDKNNILVKTHPEYYKRNFFGQFETNRYNFFVLDYTNPQTQQYIIDMVKYWVNTAGVDGCRADVAIYVPLPFWARLNNEIKRIKPSWIMIAETQTKLQEYSGKSGNLYGFDALYGVDYMRSVRGVLSKKAPAEYIKRTWEYPKGGKPPTLPDAIFYRAVDNHDQHPRAVLLSGGNNAHLASLIINFTLDGIPFLFNGQEIGDSAPTSIKTQKFISWDIPPYPENRQVISKLSSLRKSYPALKEGKTTFFPVTNNSSLIAFLRESGNEKIITIANMSEKSWQGTLPNLPERISPQEISPLISKEAEVSMLPNTGVGLNIGGWGYIVARISSSLPK